MNNTLKLNWDKKIFYEDRKRKKLIIGWDMKGSFNAFGRGQYIDDWTYMWIKGKNLKLLKSTVQLVKFSTWVEKYFINCFYYFGHLYKSWISGLTYLKIVSCSRLTKKRLKW